MACSSVGATSSLSFEAGGYLLDFEVGHTEKPVLAGVNVSIPGGKQGTTLRPPMLRVELFDAKRKVLAVSFQNSGDPTLPPGFSFAAHRGKGVLRIQGRSYKGPFQWEQ